MKVPAASALLCVLLLASPLYGADGPVAPASAPMEAGSPEIGLTGAQPPPCAECGMPIWLSVLLVEGMIAADSGLAVASPEGFGTIMVAGAVPMAVLMRKHGAPMPTTLTITASVLAIGAYNLTEMDDPDVSDGRIFRDNMIAWNLAVLAILAAVWAENPETQPDAPAPVSRFNLHTTPDRLLLTADFRF